MITKSNFQIPNTLNSYIDKHYCVYDWRRILNIITIIGFPVSSLIDAPVCVDIKYD